MVIMKIMCNDAKNNIAVTLGDAFIENCGGFGIPFLSLASECVKWWHCNNIRNKWTTFLKYAVDIREFFNEIETKPDLLQYLSDYFESIRTTPSFWAIKTMALIFRDFQDNKKVQQKTCRTFAEMTDEELEIYVKLYMEAKKINSQDEINIKFDISDKNTIPSLRNEEDFKFYLDDLSNRGFLFLTTNTGFVEPETDLDSNFTLEFNKTSEIYYDYLNKAKKLENYHIGSEINDN